jgi:cryptochrome
MPVKSRGALGRLRLWLSVWLCNMSQPPARVLLNSFHTDLRLNDSPARRVALNLNPDMFYPVRSFKTISLSTRFSCKLCKYGPGSQNKYVFAHKVSVNRNRYVLGTLERFCLIVTCSYDQNKFSFGEYARPLLLCMQHKDQAPSHPRTSPDHDPGPAAALCLAWCITHLVFEKDSARRRRQITCTCRGYSAVDILGHTLYDPQAVVDAHGGQATLSISSWRSVLYTCQMNVVLPQAVRNFPAPERPLPLPKYIPPPEGTMFTRMKHPGHLDVDLSAGDRETLVICYDIMIPSPITPRKTPHDLTIKTRSLVPGGTLKFQPSRCLAYPLLQRASGEANQKH